MIIGLTGGIGSGKSQVSSLLKEKGFEIIDADLISREVTMPGSPALKELADYFGSDILDKNEILNRKLLGERAFSSKENTNKLNSIITSRIIDSAKEKLKDNCIFDAPTLLENGLQSIVDYVLVVTAEKELRIKRVSARDGLSRKKILDIMKNQMPEKEKVKLADYVIYNNGSFEDLSDAVNAFVNMIK